MDIEIVKKEIEEYKKFGDIEKFNSFLSGLDINKNPECYLCLIQMLSSEEVGRLF